MTVFVIVLQLGLIGCANETEEDMIVEIEQQTIENIRIKYESQIMTTEGVVFVGNGLNKNGKPYLKIGTSVPIEDVRSALPDELFKIEVKLEFVGEIKAQ